MLLMLIVDGTSLHVQALLHATTPTLLGMLVGAVSTSFALVALVLALGPVSGGHFNPLITWAQWLVGERSIRCTRAYIFAQCSGAVAGALFVRAFYPTDDASVFGALASPATFVSEMGFSCALLGIILACTRSGLGNAGPPIVGAWLLASQMLWPRLSYGNPAIVVGLFFVPGPMRLASASVGVLAAAEFAGAIVALGLVTYIVPKREPVQTQV